MMAFSEWLPGSMIKTIDSRYSAVEYNTTLIHLVGTIQLMELYGDDVLLFDETQVQNNVKQPFHWNWYPPQKKPYL